GIVIGQDSDSDRAIVIDPSGTRRVLADGRCRFIRASRDGDHLAVGMWREAKRDDRVMWLTVVGSAHVRSAERETRAPPRPQPAPPKEPDPMPPVATDEIDLSTVTFLHTDIRDWPITSTLTEVELPDPGKLGVRCRHTKAGKWPESQGSEGVLIVVAEIGGRLYAASCEWLRPGQTWKPALGAHNIGASTKVAPFARKDGSEWVSAWVPQPGETIGLMVATTG